MTRSHLGRHTDAETGHAPICTRDLGGPLCAAPAAWHIIWPGGDGGMACDEHVAEARSLDPRQIHRLAWGACGLPGSLWIESERRCVLDVGEDLAVTGEEWRCPRCRSTRWVAASLTGPVEYGGRAIRQCVPCGHYSNDDVPARGGA
jgi:hypothetical protein